MLDISPRTLHSLRGNGQLPYTRIDRKMFYRPEVEILKGHISSDHVHLFLSVPPHLAISKLVQYLKSKSSHKMLQENQQLSKLFWGRHLWGRGYFVATFGNITDEVIMEYIRTQDDAEHDDDFSIG
jgi:putative transposase